VADLTGSQFLPENTAIVHRAIFVRVDSADAAKASVDPAGGGGAVIRNSNSYAD
jgi:hypothetical protein